MLVDPIPLGAQSRDVVLVCEDGVYNVDFTNYVGLQVHEGRGSNCLNPTMVSHSENPGFKGHERDPGHCACLSGPCDAGVCGQECFYNLTLQENGALPTALGFADRMEYPCRQRPSLPTATKGSRHSRLCRLPIDCGRQRSRFADSQPVGKEPQSANRILG